MRASRTKGYAWAYMEELQSLCSSGKTGILIRFEEGEN